MNLTIFNPTETYISTTECFKGLEYVSREVLFYKIFLLLTTIIIIILFLRIQYLKK